MMICNYQSNKISYQMTRVVLVRGEPQNQPPPQMGNCQQRRDRRALQGQVERRRKPCIVHVLNKKGFYKKQDQVHCSPLLPQWVLNLSASTRVGYDNDIERKLWFRILVWILVLGLTLTHSMTLVFSLLLEPLFITKIKGSHKFNVISSQL